MLETSEIMDTIISTTHMLGPLMQITMGTDLLFPIQILMILKKSGNLQSLNHLMRMRKINKN
jgi:hypothetical protein